tara:strand:+ start:1747 stop:2010 length:264 start_codon:yes stop_codon:yes gene_type:complete
VLKSKFSVDKKSLRRIPQFLIEFKLKGYSKRVISRSTTMKTKITMIAAFAVLSSGAIAAPAVVGIGGAVEVVAADQKTVTLVVSGLR